MAVVAMYVHGADMLVVMVMKLLMVTTVGMAGLVQPVKMDSLTNRSQVQPVLYNDSAL